MINFLPILFYFLVKNFKNAGSDGNEQSRINQLHIFSEKRKVIFIFN